MVELVVIRDLVAIFGVIAGFSYYVLTVRANQRSQQHQNETRQAQLYMQLYSFYDNKEFLKDYGNITMNMPFKDAEDWWNKYSPKYDIDAYSAWLRVGRFFDGVGILLEKELIEKDLIYRLLGDVIQGAWEGTSDDTGIGKWLHGTRDAYDRPNLWRHYERIYYDYKDWIKDNPI